jgi:hypothetical protein
MTFYDSLTKAHYHLQIEILDGSHQFRSIRLDPKRFASWIRHLSNQGYEVSITYDNEHHTYLAAGVA